MVTIPDSRGKDILLDTLGPGMCFGEMSKFTGKHANANVRASKDTVLYALTGEQFERIISEVPNVARGLYTELCARLENMNNNLKEKVDELLEINANLEQKVSSHIRDLEKSNHRLVERNLESEQLSRTRDEFLNMAVHDLRSPLSNTIGFVELLQENEKISSDSRLLKIIGIIERQSRNMLALINDILDINKINSGKLELELLPLEVRGLFHDTIQSSQILASGKCIELEIRVEDDLPKVRGDPRRLAEVLNNLISNAIKYSPKNTKIVLGADNAPGRQVRVYVQDFGQGIPEGDLPKLFSAFQQLSVKATAGEKGTGLGLAIVQKLVQLHGGRIDVKSKVGEGSTFAFTLPQV